MLPGWCGSNDAVSCSIIVKSEIGADWDGLSDPGSRSEVVFSGNDDNAAVGDRKALRIAHPIKADPLARRNQNMLVDNAALQLCSLPDSDTLEEQ